MFFFVYPPQVYYQQEKDKGDQLLHIEPALCCDVVIIMCIAGLVFCVKFSLCCVGPAILHLSAYCSR